jgi:hypothetical protein
MGQREDQKVGASFRCTSHLYRLPVLAGEIGEVTYIGDQEVTYIGHR